MNERRGPRSGGLTWPPTAVARVPYRHGATPVCFYTSLKQLRPACPALLYQGGESGSWRLRFILHPDLQLTQLTTISEKGTAQGLCPPSSELLPDTTFPPRDKDFNWKRRPMAKCNSMRRTLRNMYLDWIRRNSTPLSGNKLSKRSVHTDPGAKSFGSPTWRPAGLRLPHREAALIRLRHRREGPAPAGGNEAQVV